MSLVTKFVASRQWAIEVEYLRLIAAIADRDWDARDSIMELIEKRFGQPVKGTRDTTVRDGVAVIPVAGPMFRYANLFTDISGATSYERLAADLGTVMADPDIAQVIFDINSPGGEVDGVADLAEMIYEYRGVKSMTGFISHLGTSAAYWLASATNRVIVSKTAMAGGVGAVLSLTDTSGRDAEEGIQRMEFVSSFATDKRLNPFSDDREAAENAATKLQALVDTLGDIFVEMVAANRNMSPEAIRATKGGILIGNTAVEVGLADGVGTLEGLIESYSVGADTSTATLFTNQTEGDVMMEGQDQVTVTADETVIDLDYLASNHPDLLAEVRFAAAEVERERILAIHALDAQGFDEIKIDGMNDPAATPGTVAQAILSAKGEQEKIRTQSVKDGLDADEGEVANIAAATIPAEEVDSEETVAANILNLMPLRRQMVVD